MSVSSYRMKPPPPPLRFNSSSSSVGNRTSQTLLYDIPAGIASPPMSPTSKVRPLASPTSPRRSRAAERNGRQTPVPSPRNRSSTPSGFRGPPEAPPSGELEKFAENCRAWYYTQDEEAGAYMTQALANLPQSQRTPFSRLQASIRAGYHSSLSARRTAEFRAHVGATLPGGSLMPHSRADSGSVLAQKERYDRLDRFIRTWCTAGMPGTKPFFEALWGLFRLQVVPENLGGAGRNRIQWELDDAVFKEAAGKDFMLEAVDVLKGVLAFEDAPSLRRSYSLPTDSAMESSTLIHSRSKSQPLTQVERPVAIASTTNQPRRARAPSDPFLDTPALSHSAGTSSSHSSANTSLLASEESHSPIPIDLTSDHTPTLSRKMSDQPVFEEDGEEEYMRVWTSPDLGNPEILQLLKLFPSFITRRTLPRFPVDSSVARADLEQGYEERGEGREVRCGTGSMWVSSLERSNGWQGGMWHRIKAWFRKTFC